MLPARQANTEQGPEPVLATLSVAVIVPCHNEALSDGAVVPGIIRAALPAATVYVYDNCSTDETSARAAEAGAVVRREPRKGKGNVMRRMFADVEADIYIMVDGDDTYDASAAPALIKHMLEERLDMVVGARQHTNDLAYRAGHQFGNAVLTGIVAKVFGANVDDMLSGYRVMSRRFVKSFPALSRGFEIETELTVHALEIGAPVGEVGTHYRERPEGSMSKLNTIRDGIRIMKFIPKLIREERPMEFFGGFASLLFLASIVLTIPVLTIYVDTGLVPRLPTWVLAIALALLSFLSLACGLILDNVTRGRREIRRIAYLALPPPAWG